MDRIILTREDLQISFAVWLSVAGSRHPAAIRDLWTRTGEPRDIVKQEAARALLAKLLVDQLEMSKAVVMRPPVLLHGGPVSGLTSGAS